MASPARTGLALQAAKDLGFAFSMNLDPEPASTSRLDAIPRYYPTGRPGLADIVRDLRFEPQRPRTRRIACVTLDALAAAGSGRQQDKVLGHIIEGLRTLGANTVVIDANAALSSAEAPLGAVYFPTRLSVPCAWTSWGARHGRSRRGGVDVFLHLPLAASAAAVGNANVPRLFADMLRYARPDGVVIDMPVPTAPGAIIADRPEDIRARRAACSIPTGWTVRYGLVWRPIVRQPLFIHG